MLVPPVKSHWFDLDDTQRIGDKFSDQHLATVGCSQTECGRGVLSAKSDHPPTMLSGWRSSSWFVICLVGPSDHICKRQILSILTWVEAASCAGVVILKDFLYSWKMVNPLLHRNLTMPLPPQPTPAAAARAHNANWFFFCSLLLLLLLLLLSYQVRMIHLKSPGCGLQLTLFYSRPSIKGEGMVPEME